MTPTSITLTILGWCCFIWLLNTKNNPLSRQEVAALLFPIIILCFILLGVLGEPAASATAPLVLG